MVDGAGVVVGAGVAGGGELTAAGVGACKQSSQSGPSASKYLFRPPASGVP